MLGHLFHNVMNCDIDTIRAAEFDICYMAGTEISNNCTFAVNENGNPVNLLGATLTMYVKYKPEDPNTRAIIEFSTTAGTITISGASNNYITLHGVHQVAKGLRYHDIYWTEEEDYIGKGMFRIDANTTRT